MTATVISTISMTLWLAVFSPMPATAQQKDHSAGKEMSHDQMMMAKGPHQLLAMAYHQNLSAFTKALQEQTAQANSVDVEFARAAVTEMRRSFDHMKQHHQKHMQTMTAAMHADMGGMMQQMETHLTALNTQLGTLEREVQLSTPDPKKISASAAGVTSHLDAMSKMKHDGKATMMPKKIST